MNYWRPEITECKETSHEETEAAMEAEFEERMKHQNLQRQRGEVIPRNSGKMARHPMNREVTESEERQGERKDTQMSMGAFVGGIVEEAIHAGDERGSRRPRK